MAASTLMLFAVLVHLVHPEVQVLAQEWQHQDDCRTIANISHICQQMVRKCQLQHAELWPAGLLCVAASARTPDQEAEKEPAGTEALHAEEDFFASCGIPLRCCNSSCRLAGAHFSTLSKVWQKFLVAAGFVVSS